MQRYFILACTCIVLACTCILITTPAAAQQAPDAPRLVLKGMVSSTLFVQDATFGFGNGQAASWAAFQPRTDDPYFLGGDVRNTRMTLQVLPAAAKEGWQPTGIVEVDFFGGFNGSGAFSDEQPLPRLRLAYVEFGNGTTSLRIGQAATPLCGVMPVSVSHIAFPIGLGSAGVIGWRFPGIFATHRLLSSPGLQLQAQAAVMRGSWDGPGNNLEQQSAGETSPIPQAEGRLDASGTAGVTRWSTYIVGHYDRKDLSGTAADEDGDALTGSAVQVGGRVAHRALTVQGNAYAGRAIGQQFGQLTQFGDLGSVGGWGQVGVAITPVWSVWAFAGMDDIDDDDLAVIDGRVRTRNSTHALMLRRQVGGLAYGLQWLQSRTDWRDAVDAPVVRRTGNQLALSALYQF
jgi:hypothetical protein